MKRSLFVKAFPNPFKGVYFRPNQRVECNFSFLQNFGSNRRYMKNIIQGIILKKNKKLVYDSDGCQMYENYLVKTDEGKEIDVVEHRLRALNETL